MRRQSAIDRERLWEKINYAPHGAEQLEFHDSTARFRTPVCGRRFGKSKMAATDLVLDLFIPDSIYWICGPTYRLAEKEFRVVHDAFMNPKKLNMSSKIKSTYNFKQGDMTMTFPWNTRLECTSATNPDSLIGEGLDGVIMSEARAHKLETWEMYIEPALSDTLGWATFPTTPEGFNYIHGLWQMGQHPDYPDYASWRYPTWLNTLKYPHNAEPDEQGLANAELQRIKANVSERYWAQEYAASFTSFEGQIYPEFDPAVHVRDIHYNPLWRNYRAFDFGFSDPLVCLDIMVDPSDNVYVWREYQVRQKTTWEHAHILKDRPNPPGYHCDAMFADPRGADEIATLALVLGYCSAQPVGWITGVEWIKRWLKIQPDGLPKLFIDRSCVDLIRQMQGLRHLQTKEGKNSKEGQVDYDDHGPDTLRYFFNEKFVMGAGNSLADVQDSDYRGSESDTFFQTRTQISLDQHIGY